MYIDRWWYALRPRLRALIDPEATRIERAEELRYHAERLAEASGAPLPRGRLASTDEPPNGNGIGERLRRDLRHALRGLRRNPGYAAIAILTLTLGIGANAAMFTVVNAVVLRPLPYAEPSRLVVLKYARGTTVAPATFHDWVDDARSFERTALAEVWSPNLTGGDRPETLAGIRVSASMIPLLGVPPLLGRTFRADEEHAGRNRVAVLRYDYWQQRFGGDRGVIGRRVVLEGEPYTIIGVMPRGYRFVPFWASDANIAAPLVLDDRTTDRDISSLRAFARLRPGTTLERADAELSTIGRRLVRARAGEDTTLAPVLLQSLVTGGVDRPLLVLLGAVGFVLLLACANVAHLQLVRAASREREFALRTALGGSRGRLVQQSLVESLLLAVAGGVGGLTLAYAGVRLLVVLAPPSLPRLDAIAVDGYVLAFVAAVTLFTAALFGVTPALATARTNLGGVLRDGAKGSAASGGRTRSALVVSEFATALLLLAGAGLMVRSFAALLAVDAGYDRRNLLSMQVSVRGTRHDGAGQRDAFFHALVEQAATLPGVQSASATNHLPLHGDHWTLGFSIEGRPDPVTGNRPSALFRVVRPGYFRTMRIALLDGRDIGPQDEAAGARVVVVNRSMARRQWPNASPIGQRLTLDDPTRGPSWFTVVGVVGDVRQDSWDRASADEMYFTSLAAPRSDLFEPSTMTLVVRTTSDAASLTRSVEGLVHALDADAPVSDVITMEQAVDEQLAEPRFYLLLFSAFAGVALTLAAVGVYGVMSYAAAHRAREMGIRLALGARPTDPSRLVLRDGMRLAAVGSIIGLVATVVGSRALRSLLYDVSPLDPITLGIATLVLGGVAAGACWGPAWRASRIDPATALRSD
jgi:putative ABC transport system permease protein